MSISTRTLRRIMTILAQVNTVTMIAMLGGLVGLWDFTDAWQFKLPYWVLLIAGGISGIAYVRRTRREREATR